MTARRNVHMKTMPICIVVLATWLYAGSAFGADGSLYLGAFYVDIDKFGVFAKAGLARSDADGSYSSFAGPTRIAGRETDFAWGIGAERGFEKFSVRLEHERFGVANFFGNFHDPDLTAVGFTWTLR